MIGPELYTIYVNCHRKEGAVHGVKINQYSNDTTVYLEFRFPPGLPDQMDAHRILPNCAGDLADWLAFNWVRLNPDKSDFLYLAPSKLASELPLFPPRIKNQVLSPSNSARLLGVILARDLSMDSQISAMVMSSYYQLLTVSSWEDSKAVENILHKNDGSLLVSHLDYANCLQLLAKSLYAVQDSAARLIYRGRSISTDEARYRLHWLPVQQRIYFKVFLIVFDCLTGSAIRYL